MVQDHGDCDNGGAGDVDAVRDVGADDVDDVYKVGAGDVDTGDVGVGDKTRRTK